MEDDELVGFRFHPNDAEIVNYYLRYKMDGRDDLVDDTIKEVDLRRQDPWDIPDLAQGLSAGDQVWYFYCCLDYKYAKSKKANRTTKSGFWKATGKVRSVKGKGGEEIATKRTLVFYKKLRDPDPKAVRTDWVIHEYQAKTILLHQMAFVLCKLKYKADDHADGSPSYEEGEPSRLRTPDFENNNTAAQATILEAYASDGVDVYDRSPQSNMHNPQGISIEDFLVDDDPAFGSSDDEVDAARLADSFLINPDECRSAEILCTSDDRIRENQHRAVYRDSVAEEQVSTGHIQLQMFVDTPDAKAVEVVRPKSAFDLPWKESLGVDRARARETFQVNNAKPALKLRSNESASTDKNGRFIRLETPASGYGPSPPSVYILNVLLGLVLFIIILREMLIFH